MNAIAGTALYHTSEAQAALRFTSRSICKVGRIGSLQALHLQRSPKTSFARRTFMVQAVAQGMSTTSTTKQPATQRTPLKMKVQGPTAVITGGSQGVGRELALLLSSKGYNVVVVARQADRLEKVAVECSKRNGRSGSSLAVSTDITRDDQVAGLAAQVAEQYETISLLVNNAGVCMTGPFEHTTLQDVRSQLDVNFLGAVSMTQAFLPLLKESARKRGAANGAPYKTTVAFVNSFVSRMAAKNMCAYTASKFALAGFVDSIRPELAVDGIHVTQIQPGVINTDFLERAQFRGPNAQAEAAKVESVLSSGSSFVQTPLQVAQAVLDAVENERKEVMVGGAFKLAQLSTNVLGLNPFLLG